MTISKTVAHEILRLAGGEKWPPGTIASQVGVHEDVVKRLLRPPGTVSRKRPGPHAIVAPYHAFIVETLAQYPRLRSTRITDMLRARGFQGSVRTVRDYVKKVRPSPKREAFVRQDPLIGECAQIDWAYVGKVNVPGGQRELWLFVIVLAWSRALWGEFVLDLTVHSLLRSLVRAGQYFGGQPRKWLFDNAKVVVTERLGDAIRFHPLLLDLAGSLCVAPKVCAVRKPQQKGRVERAIRYLRDRFLAARVIASPDQGNRELLEFIETIAAPRPHPTIPQTTVGQCFLQEQSKLLPMPDPLPQTDQIESVFVDKTAFIAFDTNRYSVPSEHVEQTLTLVADDQTLRIYHKIQEVPVAIHPRIFGKRQLIELPIHRQALLQKKQRARAARGRDFLRCTIPHIDTLFERWVDAGRNVGNMTQRTLKLLDLYGDVLLAEAVTEAIARHVSDPAALAQILEQKRLAAHAELPIALSLSATVPERDVIPHDLERYDDTN